MSDKSNGSDAEEPKVPTPRWKVLGMECFVVVMAIVSMYSAWDAYKKMKNASSDVAGIVANWEKKPIESIHFISGGGDCLSDEEKVTLPEFPGVSSGGCGCMSGSKYDVTGEVPRDATSSASESCLTNQTGVSDYKCRDIGGLDSYANKLWVDNTICVKRGFKAATETPYPDATSGECPDNFHKCGLTNGNFDEDRVFCADSTIDATACPITWLGTTNADVQTRFKLSGAPTGAGTSVHTSGSLSITIQKGGVNTAPEVGVDENWSPLPLVDIVGAFEIPGIAGEEGLPCYGELDLQGGTRHDQYASVANTDTGKFKATSPKTCEVKDERWALADQIDHATFYGENWEKYSPMCMTSGSPYSSNPQDYDYFTTSTDCTNTVATPLGCIGKLTSDKPYTLYTSHTGSCDTGDNVCTQAFFQSRCGAQQRMDVGLHNMGLFQKTQIYWSQDCVYNYSDVIKNNGPLQKAIDWQTNLFYLNAVINGLLIIFSLYIIRLTVINWGTMKTEYAELEEVWKPRAELFGNWIKIPVVVLTIVFASAVSKFFVTLSEDSCSDPTTDSTFEQLGTALPAVIQANAIVLAMDLVGLVPIIYKKFCGGGDKETEGEVVPTEDATEDDIELAAVAPASPSAPASADGKVIVYVDGPGTIGGEGTINFPDGGSYAGFIFKDMRHNDGVMNYADGHKYEGKWKNDLRDGYGTLTSGETTVFAGEWFQDNRQN